MGHPRDAPLEAGSDADWLCKGWVAANVKSPIGPETLALAPAAQKATVLPEIQPNPTSAGVEAAIKDAAKEAAVPTPH